MADSEQRAASATEPAPPQSLGNALKQARIARELSLEQVSTELRIEAAQLDALEQDRLERIGVPVFVKGYIRQYGTFLGLDTRDLLAQYYKQNALKEIEIQPSKTITLRDERQITLWIIAALVLAAVVAALGFWWWNGAVLPAAFSPSAQTKAPRHDAAAPASTDAGRSPASIVTAEAVETAPAASSDSEPAIASPVSAGAVDATSEPVAEPAAGAARADTFALRAADDETERGPLAVATLDVTFEQESWAEINDARGQRLYYGLGAAGRSAALSGAPPFAVTLGNSAGVKLVVDGEDFPVPTTGKPGDYAQFSVDVAGD
jgi:cytoskeleton protein RodZ